MKSVRSFLGLAFFMLSVSGGYGQDTSMAALTKYTQTDGLSSYYITRIIKDSFGFLWIGTQEGLNLFDTKNFVVYSPTAQPEHRLGGSFVDDIVEDNKRHLLWVVTSYGDVCGIDLITRKITRRIEVDDQGGRFSTRWMRSLAITGDTLWIGGLGKLMAYQLALDKYLPFDLRRQTGLDSGQCNISHLFADANSRIWLFSDGYGVILLDHDWSLVRKAAGELLNASSRNRKLRFWNLAHDKDWLYAGTNDGLKVFSLTSDQKERITSYHLNGFDDSSEIMGLAVSPDKSLYYSTAQGISAWSAGTGRRRVFRVPDQDQDWLSLTYELYYDSSSAMLWAGTQSGMALFDPSRTPFRAFNKSRFSNARIRHAYFLLPDKEANLYCSDENGLFYVNTAHGNVDKLASMGVNFLLFRDQKGRVLLSNTSGFFVVDGKNITPISKTLPAAKILESDQFNCALQYNDSLVLLGSVIARGLTVWNTKSNGFRIYHRDSVNHPIVGLSIINSLFHSGSGKLFILTEKAIVEFDPVSGYNKEHLLTIPGTKTPVANFMDLIELQGHYYIGTYGQGVLVTDSLFRIERVITDANGLSNNCVYKLFPCLNGRLLATTNYGISLIDTKTWKVGTFYESDGLNSSQFEQGCGFEQGGLIYAGGVNGFSLIDPQKITSNGLPPLVYIDRVNIQRGSGDKDTSNIRLKELDIPNDVLQVTVYVSALSYRNATRTRYEYKIGEDGEKWISTNGQAFVNLPALPPGTYSLFFRACNESGIYNSSPVLLKLRFLPKWYQTLWFRIGSILLCLLLFYAFYRYRLSQIQRQQAIRKEIAGDLHDDIGSVLNSVKIFAHLAQTEPDKEQYFSHIEESLSQASYGLRDMIWVLDSKEDTLQELLDRIKKYAVPVCHARGIHFEASILVESSRVLTKPVKRNLLLIAKEAINNSIKYAECSRIYLRLEQRRSGILLCILDDGKGFDPGVATEGRGLQNIQNRAKQIFFTARISSSPGQGTRIEVRVA